MCPQVLYKVFTGTKDMTIPFAGPRMYKEAPGGLTDVMCRQTVATLSSYRPIWQAVLDKELVLMAELRLRL